MKTYSQILGLIAAGLFSPIFAATVDSVPGDLEPLKAWIATKRQVTVKERGGNLSISGDVRTSFAAINETANGIQQRGPGSANPSVPDRAFGIAFNLTFDYRTDQTWSSIKFRYANEAGTISGTTGKIALDRAFLGIRVITADNFVTDIEFGRRKLNYSFDSKIEFAALMDGILIKYDQSSEYWGDFYIHGGPFVVNEKQNQFAYVIEAGILNFYNTGLYTKYSIIDWDTKNFSDPIEELRFRYVNSQFLLGYTFLYKRIDKLVTLYSAFLINTASRGALVTDGQKENKAWYAGFTIGQARKRGDWAFDWNYQWVQPYAVPDYDASGFGKGNAAGVGMFTTKLDGSGAPTTRATAVGKANYKGWKGELLYLITDTITVNQSLVMSESLTGMGPFIKFKQYKLEFIYAF